jgi:D-methionine transport system substrate-binding protein
MKKLILLGLVFFVAGGFLACTKKSNDVVVRVGVVGSANDYWQPAIVALAKEGIKLELVTFNSYVEPNQYLAAGDIELTSFQTYASLSYALATNENYDFSPIGETVIVPLGLYSKKIKNVAALKKGNVIAIANDPINQARALLILQANRLITINPKKLSSPKLEDIIDNPLRLEFLEVEAGRMRVAIDQVVAAFINGNVAVDMGLNPIKNALLLERRDDENSQYINVIVARTENKDNPFYKKVVEAFQNDQTKRILADKFPAFFPAWK